MIGINLGNRFHLEYLGLLSKLQYHLHYYIYRPFYIFYEKVLEIIELLQLGMILTLRESIQKMQI